MALERGSASALAHRRPPKFFRSGPCELDSQRLQWSLVLRGTGVLRARPSWGGGVIVGLCVRVEECVQQLRRPSSSLFLPSKFFCPTRVERPLIEIAKEAGTDLLPTELMRCSDPAIAKIWGEREQETGRRSGRSLFLRVEFLRAPLLSWRRAFALSAVSS